MRIRSDHQPARRLARFLIAGLLLAVLATAGTLIATEPVGAATQGTGFGSWASSSRFGWHGSMRVGNVHTYCITPGAPLPVGSSTDRGDSTAVAGLSAQQLAGINHLVTRYGQTDDPVQAAAVGWAVKATSNWDEAMHSYGYPGTDLRGAINWSFSGLAPEHNQRVQDLAVAYVNEAKAVAPGPSTGHGTVVFSIDEDDPLLGSVRVDADPSTAVGTLELSSATFTDTGTARRDDIRPGQEYPITAVAPNDGNAFRVAAHGTFRIPTPAVIRHFTTAGGQDTAGPPSTATFEVAGKDVAPRTLSFSPTITTKVVSRYQPGGPFRDEVTFSAAEAWPRDDAGGYLAVKASGVVYRTANEPVKETPAPPKDAEPIATIELRSSAATGPTVPYRVETDAPLPGPGFYTAVWTIDAEHQADATRRRLPEKYRWVEPFGERTQITMVPDVSSQAQPSGTVGDGVTDTIIVGGPIPATGLYISAALYRAPDGAAPADSCTDASLVWDGAATPTHVTEPGRFTIAAPTVPDFGTYYWRERATDAEGDLVQLGACGVPEETTTATPPTIVTRATPEVGYGGEAVDLAIVSGDVPTRGATEVTFEIFTGTEAPVCTAETLVADTTDTPVPVTAAGEVPSPPIRVERSGPHYWVESLWWTPEGGERRLLARGTCGAEHETTVVRTPEVTTRATERAAVGSPYTDTATVSGLGDGVEAELMFFVYRGEHDAAPVCTADTLEATTAPVAVRGDGEYVSPAVTSQDVGVRHWIAQLQYVTTSGETVLLHRGECGEEHESTLVDLLAETGPSSAGGVIALGSGAAVAGGAALLLGSRWLRSRRPVVA